MSTGLWRELQRQSCFLWPGSVSKMSVCHQQHSERTLIQNPWLQTPAPLQLSSCKFLVFLGVTFCVCALIQWRILSTNGKAEVLEVVVDVLSKASDSCRDSLCTRSSPSSSVMVMDLLSHRSSELTIRFFMELLFTPITNSRYVPLKSTSITYFPPALTMVRSDLYTEWVTCTFKGKGVWLLISVVDIAIVREQLCDCNSTWIHKLTTTRVKRPALNPKQSDQVFLIVTDRVPARASVMLVIWSLRRHTLTKIPLENLTSHFIASPLPSQYKLSVVSFFRFLRLTAVLYMPEHVLNMQISKIWKGGNLSSKPHLSINSIRWHFLPLLLHLNLKEANWYNFLMQSYFIHSQGGFVWTDPKTWVVSTFGIQGAMWWEAPYQLNVDETCWAS